MLAGNGIYSLSVMKNFFEEGLALCTSRSGVLVNAKASGDRGKVNRKTKQR